MYMYRNIIKILFSFFSFFILSCNQDTFLMYFFYNEMPYLLRATIDWEKLLIHDKRARLTIY